MKSCREISQWKRRISCQKNLMVHFTLIILPSANQYFSELNIIYLNSLKMFKNQFINFIVILLTSLSLLPSGSCRVSEKTPPPEVKNIIFLIGDGVGLSQIQAAMTRKGSALHIEKLPVVGLQKTDAANNYVTDSAASATALASGKKVNNGSIGIDPEGNFTESIIEVVEKMGLKSGLVATNTITHATPAGFAAHQPDRNMYEEIALDLVSSGVDVLIGGGRDHFIKRKDSLNLEEKMKTMGFEVVQDLTQVSGETERLLALLTDSHMPYVLDGRGNLLQDMVETALQVLNFNNKKGFFLMIEGSQVDPACHAQDIEKAIAEMLDFDLAVGKALDFAIRDGNTLVVVTGDHETGGLTILRGNYETGEMSVNFSTGGHTGIMLPVFSFGPGAEKFSGIFDNTGFKSRFLECFGFN